MSFYKHSVKVLAALLSVAILAGGMPVSAATETNEEKQEIISFADLPEEITNQSVLYGTALEKLNLPGTLNVTLQLTTEEEEIATQGTTTEQEILVNWESSPLYDSKTSGTYCFIPVIENLDSKVELPEITVTVEDEIKIEKVDLQQNGVEANGTADVSGLDWEIIGTTLTIKSNKGTSDWEENGIKIYKSLIERVVLQDDVSWINSEEFSDCSKLSSIKISNKVSTIPSSAFKYCTSLTSVDIPEGVSDLNATAFTYCNSLTDINVNNNNSTYCSIDGIVYSKDTETLICYPAGKTAKEFNLPNGVKRIGEWAFSYNRTLNKIEIPEGLNSIEHGAFLQSLSLKSINLPKSISSIGNTAFYQCGILSIEIPENLVNIGVEAFSACTRLTEINVNNNNAVYYSIDGVIYEKDTKELLNYPAGKTDIEFTVPSGTCSISGSAFSACAMLTQIVIPESVSSIGNYAFDRCFGMTQITFLSKIPPDMGKKIFLYASKMSDIYVPSTSVDNYKAVENLSTYVDMIQENNNSNVTVNQGSGSGNYDKYATVTIEANPDTQERVFQSWSCSDGVVLADFSNRKTTFTMPGNDVTVTANYKSLKVKATAMTLNKKKADLKFGYTVALNASITPANATDKSVTWSSSNTAIATVDKNGKVTGKGIGKATITATSNGNIALKATCSIQVSIGKVKSLKAKKNKTTSITLTWNKQKHVKGYVVYRYDSAKKKYVKIATIKKASTTTYTDTKRKAATTYQYKVRAYATVAKKTKYGSYSSILKTATASQKPSVKAKARSKKTTLTWGKVKSVSGYEIYMSTKKSSKYSKIKTVSSKSTKYTKTKLKKGKTYYFKIRTYKKVNGIKIYSSYSSVKKVKAK